MQRAELVQQTVVASSESAAAAARARLLIGDPPPDPEERQEAHADLGIVHPEEGAVLFDTGYNTRLYREPCLSSCRTYAAVLPVAVKPEEDAAHQLDVLGYRPEEIKWIILSHFHVDHCAGLLNASRDTSRLFVLFGERIDGHAMSAPHDFSKLVDARGHLRLPLEGVRTLRTLGVIPSALVCRGGGHTFSN